MFNPFNIENTFHLSSDLQDLITLNSMITIVMQDSIELIIGRNRSTGKYHKSKSFRF